MSDKPNPIASGADAVMAKAAQNIYRNSAKFWFLRYGVVKDINGVIVRWPQLKLRVVQERMFEHHDLCLKEKRPCRQIVLKPRKDGASTAGQAIMYHRGRKFANREGALMGDVAGTSQKVFSIYRTFAENDLFDWGDGLPNLRADDKVNNLEEDIHLPNGSTYIQVTAGSTNANRGGTLQLADSTETAYYRTDLSRDPLAGFLGSANLNSEFSYGLMDSTSNGPFGRFFEYFMDERNDWHKIFVAWHEEPDYRRDFESAEEEAHFIRDMSRYEHELKERFSLTLEQLHWRRDKLINTYAGDEEMMNKECPASIEEAFLAKSSLRFNVSILANMERMANAHPPKKGDFITQEDGSASFIPDPQGDVKIFEEPTVGRRYLGAFDPCAGEDQQAKGQSANPDWHSVGILRDSFIDPTNGHHYPPMLAAHYHSRADVAVATETAAAMSRFYGSCMFVVETNGVGLYPVKSLEALNVPLWARKVKGKTPGQMDTQNGWFSNEQLRTTIIDTLGAYIQKWKPEDPSFECWDLDIIGELKKIVTSSGRDEAMAGHHDDCVMMLAMGLYLRSNATLLLEPKAPRVNFEKLLKQQGWKLQGAYRGDA